MMDRSRDSIVEGFAEWSGGFAQQIFEKMSAEELRNDIGRAISTMVDELEGRPDLLADVFLSRGQKQSDAFNEMMNLRVSLPIAMVILLVDRLASVAQDKDNYAIPEGGEDA